MIGNITVHEVRDLNCPSCKVKHYDIDLWADKPHRTHLCLHCHMTFEDTVRGTSNPVYTMGYLKSKYPEITVLGDK